MTMFSHNPAASVIRVRKAASWQTTMMVLYVLVVQSASVFGHWLLMSTVVKSQILAITTSIALGTMPSFFLCILFSVAPLDQKVIKLLSNSSGGMLAAFGMLILFAVLYYEFPIWLENDYLMWEALVIVIASQIPAAISASFFSLKMLTEIFDEKIYVTYIESYEKVQKGYYALRFLGHIQEAIEDVFNIVGNDPVFEKLFAEKLNKLRGRSVKTMELVQKIADQKASRTEGDEREFYGYMADRVRRLPLHPDQLNPAVQPAPENEMASLFGDTQ